MVDIVIVNWNSGNYLFECLQSIFTDRNIKLVGSIFVIDNNSSDSSLKKIEKTSEVVIVKNKENRGFAKACNQGFKLCKSSYILLLNPDAQLLKTTLEECFSFMNSHVDIDILGCQLLNDDGHITHSCARFPTPLGFFYDATGLSKLAPRIFTPAILMTDWSHKESRNVDQVMGAFMFMRHSVFQKIGFFDEQFFVYYEELDFSKRLSETGGISYFKSEIKAIHSGEGTTKNVKAYRLFLSLNSRLLYSKKHFSRVSYTFVKFNTLLIEPFTRSIFLLWQGNVGEIKNVWKAYFLLWKKKPFATN